MFALFTVNLEIASDFLELVRILAGSFVVSNVSGNFSARHDEL